MAAAEDGVELLRNVTVEEAESWHWYEGGKGVDQKENYIIFSSRLRSSTTKRGRRRRAGCRMQNARTGLPLVSDSVSNMWRANGRGRTAKWAEQEREKAPFPTNKKGRRESEGSARTRRE